VGGGLVSFALGTDTAGSGTTHDSKSSQSCFSALVLHIPAVTAGFPVANQLC